MLGSAFRRLIEPLYVVMRVFIGLLFTAHGAQKLFGMFGEPSATNNLIIAAGVIEFFGGLAIAAGLFTHLVAFLAAGEMAAAYWMVHAPVGPIPIRNGGELALLYMFTFLFIMARGGGAWSLDALIFSRPRL